jgi:hypothetical protein
MHSISEWLVVEQYRRLAITFFNDTPKIFTLELLYSINGSGYKLVARYRGYPILRA